MVTWGQPQPDKPGTAAEASPFPGGWWTLNLLHPRECQVRGEDSTQSTMGTDSRVQKGCTGLTSAWESVSQRSRDRHPGRITAWQREGGKSQHSTRSRRSCEPALAQAVAFRERRERIYRGSLWARGSSCQPESLTALQEERPARDEKRHVLVSCPARDA